DTEIRIYRAGQTLFDGYLDDNGPFCQTRASSLTFRAPADGTYYVVFSEWPCLGFTTDTLKYSLRSNFSVAPVVNYILPTSGVVGDTITIFGDNLLENNGLQLGDIPITPLPFADNSVMRIVIPFNATSNNIAFRHPDGDVLSPEVLYVCYSSTAQINGGIPVGNLCNGNTILLRATAAGFNNFVWNTGETTQEIEVTNPGIYTVRGVNPACTSLTSNAVNIQTAPNSTVSLVLFENILTATTTTPNGVFEWFRNDTLINIQSGSQLPVLKNGVYVVRYTSENGCIATDSINVVLSALGKKAKAPFKLYPNPANNSFQINSNAIPLNSQVSIANMAGSVLATFPYEMGKVYPISNLKAGTYLVTIQQNSSGKKKQVLGTQLLLVVK
ncbi:MAG: T9SS type A sorting domain-containing protein, partial [Flexibacteraceae bacterium]